MSHTGSSKKAIFAALGANLSIAAAKFAAFLITGSSSMLSEAVHSLADSTNQALLLVGSRHAKQKPTRAHPFGKSGVRYVYGFLVAVIIFALGGVFSLYEGFHKIAHPEPLEKVWVAYAVLGFALLAEGFALRTALKETKTARHKLGFFNYIRRTRNPEFPVLLLEDSGALLGLVFATVAVTVSVLTGNGVYDGVGSIAIGLLMVVAAVLLAKETGSLLIGESALPEQTQLIQSLIPDGKIITQVIHLRTLHVGPDVLLVVVKVAVPPHITADVLSVAVNEAELRVRSQVKEAKYIFIEADVLRDGHSVDPHLYPHDPDDE